MALSLAAGAAFAQGADGPQFPNLLQVKVGDAAQTQLKGPAPAEPVSNIKAPAGSFTADGPAYQPTRAMGAGRERTEVSTETIKANRAGEFGHATTPY
jgi:hypothetical protein